jgi:Soluble NSF attachment protein, SNAP
MSAYKQNAASNRDALFGSANGAPKTKGKKATTSTVVSKSDPAALPQRSPQRLPPPVVSNSNKTGASSISADARAAKTKEAEEYKQKANKCMESGIFKRPDPIAASTFYKRAADCYRVLQDDRLERLYRVESAECNRQCQAWPSAANDYIRAATLCDNDPKEASALYIKAAAAWTEAGETAKAAKAQVDAAMVFHSNKDGSSSQYLNEATILQLERAVEAHVPDPLNPYARYRQTGSSVYLDPDSDETVGHWTSATMDLAQHHLVRDAYAHEPLISICTLFASAGQFASALYAAGAVSKVLHAGGLATLTLARAYFTETILTLAMGDPVLANERFMNPHLQDNFYLKSRECAAAEDLIRAIRSRDEDALEEARTNRQHKTAIANLPPALQAVVEGLRTSGVARLGGTQPKPKSTTAAGGSNSNTAASSSTYDNDDTGPLTATTTTSLNDILNAKTGYEGHDGEEVDVAALDDELDALDFGDGDDDDELDDDDVDLR